MPDYIIKTNRLGLRNWQEKDIYLAHKMNSNEDVMEFFPRCLSLEETKNFIDRMKFHYEKHGFCYFAVDQLDTKTFIGFIGLLHQTYETEFTPFVDVGWRLLPKAWGNGFATEGAMACLQFAFTNLNLQKVYSVAPELNKRSQRVMQKIGMQKVAHFRHPKIDKNDPLVKCVAYCILPDQL